MTNQVLFCAVDIVDSTSLKTMFEWQSLFIRFFYEFDSELRERSASNKRKYEWNLWRVLGDELTYYTYVDSDDEIVEKLIAFLKVISVVEDMPNTFNKLKFLKNDSFKLRGYSFLINEVDDFSDTNSVGCYKIVIPRKKSFQRDVYEDNGEGATSVDTYVNYMEKEKNARNTDHLIVDFIGRQMDQGFRISDYSTHIKFPLSPNLALLVMKSNDKKLQNQLRYHGMKRIKGYEKYPEAMSSFPVYYILRNEQRSSHWQVLQNQPTIDLTKAREVLDTFIETEKCGFIEQLEIEKKAALEDIKSASEVPVKGIDILQKIVPVEKIMNTDDISR